jgi:phosphonate transport system substrate-binding protein
VVKKACALFLGVLVFLGGTLGVQAASDPDPKTLKVALLPDESPATIIKNNQALKSYLEKSLGKNIELVVTTDYSSMIEAMRHGRLDLGFFGPLSYVLARQKSEIEPFAALKRKGKTTYQGVVVGNAAAKVKSLADVAGKDVAFGDVASTSSHLIPKYMLAQKGLKPGDNYKEHFVGSHDSVALAVQNGNAQAGGLSKTIFQSLVERKIIDPAKVVVLAESEEFPEYPWTMRSDLSPELKKKIVAAFIDMKDKNILKPFKADGFDTISDKDYDKVRKLAQILNLDLTKMQ